MITRSRKGNIEFEDSKAIGWFCDIHNMFNDVITYHCAYCKYCKRPEILEQVANYTRVKRLGLLMASDDKDLFIRLFAAEKLLIADMDMVTLSSRKEELRTIIIQAKIRTAAIDDEERNRKAKMSAEQREWLLSGDGNDPNVTDAIKTVKKRAERMSKADKLQKDLAGLGIDTAEIQGLMSKVTQKQISSSVTTTSSRVMRELPPRTEKEDDEVQEERKKKQEETRAKLNINLSFLKK